MRWLKSMSCFAKSSRISTSARARYFPPPILKSPLSDIDPTAQSRALSAAEDATKSDPLPASQEVAISDALDQEASSPDRDDGGPTQGAVDPVTLGRTVELLGMSLQARRAPLPDHEEMAGFKAV